MMEALEPRLMLSVGSAGAPTVEITAPLPGESFSSGALSVSADASDEDGTVERVEFQWSGDGMNWRSSHFYDGDTPVPGATDWYGANGWALDFKLPETHDDTLWVRARAYDNDGLSSEWTGMSGSFSVMVPGYVTDEFTGSDIDQGLWNVFDDTFIVGGNWAEAENISVADGIAALTMANDAHPAHPRRGAQIIACNDEGFTAFHTYGSYMARMKAEEGSGATTAFFTYRELPEEGSEGNNLQEIDIEIFGEDPNSVHFTVWYNEPSVNGETGVGKRITATVAVDTTTWHEYGFDWEADGLTFCIDGLRQDMVLYYFDAAEIRQPVYDAITERPGIVAADFQQAYGVSYLPDAPAPVYLNAWVHQWADPPLFTGELDAQFDYVNMPAAVNLPPEIDSLRGRLDPLTVGEGMSLVACDVEDLDGTIVKVEFYRDADGDGALDAGVDEYLGDGVNAGGGEWTFSATLPQTTSNTYFARAQDSSDDWSEAVSCSIVMLTRDSDPFAFQDATADQVTLQYKGRGEALVTFPGPTTDGSDIESVFITGATSKSSFYLTANSLFYFYHPANSLSPVRKIEIYGNGFRTLDVAGDVDWIDIGIQPDKKVKNIIVGGTLGDVDATDVKKINLIQADRIIGSIDAQYIKKLIVGDDFDGAFITAGGSSGKIRELRAGGDVIDSVFASYKGIRRAYIDGNVVDSSFEAYGRKGKLDKFYITGDVVNSGFEAGGYKGQLGKFYIGGDVVDSDFEADGYKGSLGKFYVGYDWKGRILPGTSDFLGSMSADRKITRVYVTGAIYGAFYAPRIDKLGSMSDYFRNPDTEVKDSWTEHCDYPEGVKNVFDCDGPPVSA